ncbi:ATP-dependent DNA helicase [Bacillus carboniphilus]|uniref:ATP-dependent DNA helicase n=1 Tax=Bacillus carboniphilus TaxID=86663 RepID=A0ABY9JWC3_9BACI|nr:ATP-dependent DNA helicase [Bacillus carboniphilus]WLR43691.1 ATP-dependent DNA helicase [Bacillus carboniphilus]
MLGAKLPFSLSKDESFYEALNGWIGDVLYDILPEHGFEIRDEQVYMAFQLDRAFKDKQVIFAEAGVGTGKTIVYLLYSLCYARYSGKPAIITCADETLIEQLVKKQGDIAKLEEILNINMDVRLAKSSSNYLCLNKLDGQMDQNDHFGEIYNGLPTFVEDTKGMQSFFHYGDRKQYPHLNDDQWEQINWDRFQDCFSCPKRHRCGLTLTRDYYRNATDFIICSHDFYMEHIWTEEARKREGQLPLLPKHSCVVFDEGHLLEYAAQKALTYKVKKNTLHFYLEKLLTNDMREQTSLLIEEVIVNNDQFFYEIKNHHERVEGSNRLKIIKNKDLLFSARQLLSNVERLTEALVFESEMYAIDHYDLRIVEEYLEQLQYSFHLFLNDQKAIYWGEEDGDEQVFIVMPKKVEDTLKKELFSIKKPYIFSSATMTSHNGDFDYLAKSLGIEDYLSFSVNSPFAYDQQMKATALYSKDSTWEPSKQREIVNDLLLENQGATLILFRAEEELQQFKRYFKHKNNILFEGDQEISELVSQFQKQKETTLCAVHLWEGLDIPGQALTQVIIWSLPFPSNDPVFEAKRADSNDPYVEVDLPYMTLRLKQGIGRLIRTSADSGKVFIFVDRKEAKRIKEKIQNVVPTSLHEK